MSVSREVLVIRPKPRRQALFLIDGENPEQARERRLVALPVLIMALLVGGYSFTNSADDIGLVTALVVWGGLLIVVTISVLALTAAERHPAVRITRDDLVVERWLGPARRYPRDQVEVSETTWVVGGVADQQVTFVLGARRKRLVRLLGPRRRTLLTLSRQHWDSADIDSLVRHLRVGHVVHRGEVLTMAQVRRRYRGAFVVTTRRPVMSGLIGAAVLVTGIFGLVWTFA